MDRVHFRTPNYHGWLLSACAALALVGSFGADNALGQLRTGRSGSREFYDDSRAAPPKRRVTTDRPEIGSKVVQAGCRTCVQGADGNVVHHHDDGEYTSEAIVESDEELVSSSLPTCGACGGEDGTCGCDGIPHINIRLAFPFARAFEHLSVRMEAATFWRDPQNVPALVRTGNFGATGTSDLFGGSAVADENSQGYRGEAAWCFGKDACTSVQFRFFDAGAQSSTFDSRVATGSIPNIVLPYNNVPGSPAGPIVIRSSTPVVNGDVLAHATSDLFGGDILLRQIAYRSCNSKLDVLFGYQTASLTESIFVNSSNTVGLTSLELRDRFDTNNRFHGGVIGLSGTTHAPRWSLSSMVKLGMGTMNRYVGIDGDQTIAVGPAPLAVASQDQGLHARATNMGSYRFDTFVVSPEVNVTFGFRLTRRLEATVGYDYLLLPKVARAADQFDNGLLVNLNNPLTGDPRPSFLFTQSDLGIHSLNYGLQYRY